jgi:hypothetical protein
MKPLFWVATISLVLLHTAHSAQAQDISGRWKGTWTSAANSKHREHSGPLRVHLTSNYDGTYRGIFVGRFAKVIPYIYRGTVTQYGNQVVSTKRLGPLGEYRMELSLSPNTLHGGWTAAGESGAIHLQRP